MRVLSLYIHVPFCTRRCPYCSFYHVARNSPPKAEADYVDALAEEIACACAALGDVRFETIFVGGGTPSALGHELLTRAFDAISPYTEADVTTEVTVEMNPEDVDDSLLAVLRGCGTNRVSLGVQSMDADAQRILRRCTPEVNFRAIERAAQAFDCQLRRSLGRPRGRGDAHGRVGTASR
jgi:oxygen-independent coproporphyrinogen-3 oxidase